MHRPSDALDLLAHTMATSSRDWSRERVDALLYALLCGWECEDMLDDPEHRRDDVCGGDKPLHEVTRLHGWGGSEVALLRSLRAAIRGGMGS